MSALYVAPRCGDTQLVYLNRGPTLGAKPLVLVVVYFHAPFIALLALPFAFYFYVHPTIVPTGVEPASSAPKADVIGHYTTGLLC